MNIAPICFVVVACTMSDFIVVLCATDFPQGALKRPVFMSYAMAARRYTLANSASSTCSNILFSPS